MTTDITNTTNEQINFLPVRELTIDGIVYHRFSRYPARAKGADEQILEEKRYFESQGIRVYILNMYKTYFVYLARNPSIIPRDCSV